MCTKYFHSWSWDRRLWLRDRVWSCYQIRKLCGWTWRLSSSYFCARAKRLDWTRSVQSGILYIHSIYTIRHHWNQWSRCTRVIYTHNKSYHWGWNRAHSRRIYSVCEPWSMWSRNSNDDISNSSKSRSIKLWALLTEYHRFWIISNIARRMWKLISSIHAHRRRHWYWNRSKHLYYWWDFSTTR